MSASVNNWAGEGMFAERIPEKHEPSPTPEPDSRQGEETAAFVLVPREPTEAMLAMEKRANAATPGPWTAMRHRVVWLEVASTPGTIAESVAPEDAAFIAHTRTDIPALIAEVRRLQEDRRFFRQRIYGLMRVKGPHHSTACAIWGDNGQGGTAEGFAEPLPCTCGALVNYATQRADAAEKGADAYKVVAERAINIVEVDGAGQTNPVSRESYRRTVAEMRAALSPIPDPKE